MKNYQVMIPALQPSDQIHLDAADGWIGLGDYSAANEELEQITTSCRAHPEVLHLRWRICAHCGKWKACLELATALTSTAPEQPFSWASRAQSLHELGRTKEAKRLLLQAVKRFRCDSGIAYYLAR